VSDNLHNVSSLNAKRTFRNQDLFPHLLSKGLADILERGLLGTALVKVSVAVKDPAGDMTTSV
jgi:hypothetical protein